MQYKINVELKILNMIKLYLISEDKYYQYKNIYKMYFQFTFLTYHAWVNLIDFHSKSFFYSNQPIYEHSRNYIYKNLHWFLNYKLLSLCFIYIQLEEALNKIVCELIALQNQRRHTWIKKRVSIANTLNKNDFNQFKNHFCPIEKIWLG